MISYEMTLHDVCFYQIIVEVKADYYSGVSLFNAILRADVPVYPTQGNHNYIQ